MSNIGAAWDYDLGLPDDDDRTITLAEYRRQPAEGPMVVLHHHGTDDTGDD